jgi:multiple antibiotic resistance protein
VDHRFLATAFATAFTIVDPIAMIPITIATTENSPPERRRAIVNQAALVAACVAAFMGVAGGTLLRYLGISLAAFTIAGGVLLFIISIDMIFARPTGAKRTPSEERDAMTATNPAVFPLAVPMLVGPATITTILILVNVAKGDALSLFVVFLAFGSAIATAWACMLGSRYLAKFIGNTGIHVVSRLLGIILAGLAVQFVINGIGESPVLHGYR